MNPQSHLAKKQRLLLITMVLGLAVGSMPVFTAYAQTTCNITQITDSVGGITLRQAINGDGTRIVFDSDRDLTGGNPDASREVFLFDTTTSATTQITADPSRQSTGPSIDAGGTLIAFGSTANLTGGNSDNNPEVFLFDSSTSITTQITNSTGGGTSGAPSISADGTRIAFISNRDLLGSNSDLNREVFLHTIASGTTIQLTNSTSGSSHVPSINADGSFIAFNSDSNLTGGNADLNFEIYLYNTTTSTLTQVTNSTGGGSFGTSISADGTRIAFYSDRDLTGGNSDGNREVFIYDTVASAFTQITDTTGAGGGNVNPSISADGMRIAFQSDRDLTGNNPDGNDEIFVFDSGTSTLIQVTDSTGGFNSTPTISGDGGSIAFYSNRDHTGGNPDEGYEIFLATCPLPAPPPPAPPPLPEVIKRVDREVAPAGDGLTYTIEYVNRTGGTLTLVTLVDTFDARLVGISIESVSHGSASISGNTITVNGGIQLVRNERLRVVVRVAISDSAQQGDVICNNANLSDPTIGTQTSNTVCTTVVGVLPDTGFAPIREQPVWLLGVLLTAGGLVVLGLRRRFSV